MTDPVNREALVRILRENLPLTCGRNCSSEISTQGEAEAYSDTADEILALFSCPSTQGEAG